MQHKALLLLALLAPWLSAGDASPAERILREAVASQGRIDAKQIRDVQVEFAGEIFDESVHAIRRQYWYRTADRSFRVRTEPQAAKSRATERGVLGKSGYWDRASDGSRIDLARSNEEHRDLIQAIRRERDDFERILQLVVLSRLEDGKTRVTLAEPAPVRIEPDTPWEARSILGSDRSAHAYHVLDVEREGEFPLRLYVDTASHTIAKAVQFDRESKPAWFYYFGPYRRRADALDLNVPLFMSVHDALPEGDDGRKATTKLKGEVHVRLNSNLQDADLRP